MRGRRSLSDAGTVALAVGAVVGALVPSPLPVVVVAGVVALGWLAGRPVLFVLAVSALASALAQHTLDAARPQPAHRIDGIATVVSDPESRGASVRADIRFDGARYELEASDGAIGALRNRLAGEEVRVSGTVRPRPDDMPWLLRRHVVGRIAVSSSDALVGGGDGGLAARTANRFRRLLAQGANSLDPGQRALFTGFVFGDDREATGESRFDFRASGLTHLLAVSGANVAFVLALTGPILRRLGLRTRFVVAAAVLAFFALVTRFEPSVLRATAMAVVALGCTTLGWPASAVRVLALAVAGLILVDPLLAGSLAFQLSVAASAGIVVLARPIAAWLPGPAVLTEATAVAVAAQISVAPLLVPAFGGVPVAAVPANLLAAWAAGPVMVWGLTAGTFAGLVGGPVAALVHVPTRLLLGWVAWVARAGSSAPLGDFGVAHVAALALVGIAVAAVERGIVRVERRHVRRAALAAVAVVVATTLAGRPSPPPGTTALSVGAVLDVAPGGEGGLVLTIDGRARAEDLLGALRGAGVDHLDVLVVRTGSRSAASVAQIVVRRFDVAEVLAPSDDRLPDAVVPDAGLVLAVGGLTVRARTVGGVVEVIVGVEPAVTSAGVRSSRARVTDHLGPRAPPLRHHPPRRRDGDPQPHA